MKAMIKAARKGGRIEVTRTVTMTLTNADLEARRTALQSEIQGYDLQLAFLADRRAEAQEELNQLLAVDGE